MGAGEILFSLEKGGNATKLFYEDLFNNLPKENIVGTYRAKVNRKALCMMKYARLF